MSRRLVLLFCLPVLGCSESPTQILVLVHLDLGLKVDQIQIAAQSGTRSFPRVRRPEVAAGAPLADPQSVAILLPDGSAGQPHTITVEGLRQGAVVVATTDVAVPVRGQSVPAEVWLGSHPVDGGADGRRDGGKDLPRRDSTPDGVQCTANAFLGCQGTVLQRCNGTGSGIVTQDCKPFSCNSAAGRCNECDPAAPASCSSVTSLIECTADGLKKSTTCSLGCSAGACCLDDDKDSSTSCAGDCDDADPNAHPGQTAFFSVTTKGKGNFDYNCDKIEEKEAKDPESCVRVGSDCQGHGWQGTAIPGCGVQGVFITCKPSGMTSCSHDQSQKVQGCR
jgi:hypothetical protein